MMGILLDIPQHLCDNDIHAHFYHIQSQLTSKCFYHIMLHPEILLPWVGIQFDTHTVNLHSFLSLLENVRRIFLSSHLVTFHEFLSCFSLSHISNGFFLCLHPLFTVTSPYLSSSNKQRRNMTANMCVG